MTNSHRYHVWQAGHSATNYSLWRSATQPFPIDWSPDYEPYVLIDRGAPLFDTRFVGFGWNKVGRFISYFVDW